MSLRFTLDSDVPNRLLVVPSIRSAVLEVPVESVPELLVGQVDRGELRTGGATLGACGESPDCPNGRRDASTAALEIPEGVAVERALLVWEGDRSGAAWAGFVGLIPGGSSTAVTVTAGNVPPPSGALTTGPGVGNAETQDAAGFTSVADVTDLVRAAGGGDWTVVRAPSRDELGDGSWTLTVITAEPASPRRLLVVLRPAHVVEPDALLEISVPVSGSATPRSPLRPVELVLQAAITGSGTSRLVVNGVTVSEDAFDGIGAAGGTVTYDLGDRLHRGCPVLRSLHVCRLAPSRVARTRGRHRSVTSTIRAEQLAHVATAVDASRAPSTAGRSRRSPTTG